MKDNFMASVNLASLEAQNRYDEAQIVVVLPEDPMSVLDKLESEALGWDDNEELPQKATVLREIQLARKAFHDNDEGKLRYRFFRMKKNIENYHNDFASIALEATVDVYSKVQSERASKPRKPPEIDEIIAELAKRSRAFKAKELWPDFISMLEGKSMSPEESGNPKQPLTWKLKCLTAKGGLWPVTFRNFQTQLGKARKKVV